MRRIEALTDRSWKHMAFSKFALVGEILLSLIRLRTVSSYETASQEKQGHSCVFLPRVRRGEKGRGIQIPPTRQTHTQKQEFMIFIAKSEKRGKGERNTDPSYNIESHAHASVASFSYSD